MKVCDKDVWIFTKSVLQLFINSDRQYLREMSALKMEKD